MNDEKLDLMLNDISCIKLKLAVIEFNSNYETSAINTEEIKSVIRTIDRLAMDVLVARTSEVENRIKIKELKTRIERTENHVGLTA